MLSTPAKQRSEVQKYLADKFEKKLTIDNAELKKLDAGYKRLAGRRRQASQKAESEHPAGPQIRALWDRGEPSPTLHLSPRRSHLAGRPGRAGRSLGADRWADSRLKSTPPWPGANKTGRRLALARWLVEPDHPLTARVMVNRIWRHHFGRGIVSTLDNFGTDWHRRRRIPNCSTGWPASSSPAAGASSRCTG